MWGEIVGNKSEIFPVSRHRDKEWCHIVYNALQEGSLNDEDTIVVYKFVHPTRWGHCGHEQGMKA